MNKFECDILLELPRLDKIEKLRLCKMRQQETTLQRGRTRSGLTGRKPPSTYTFWKSLEYFWLSNHGARFRQQASFMRKSSIRFSCEATGFIKIFVQCHRVSALSLAGKLDETGKHRLVSVRDQYACACALFYTSR